MHLTPRTRPHVRQELSELKAGWVELDSALNAPPPPSIPISFCDRIFNRKKAKAIRETNRYNAEQFSRWQKSVRAQANTLRFVGFVGSAALALFAVFLHRWLLGVLAGFWFLLTLVWLSRITTKLPEPEVRNFRTIEGNGGRAALGGVGFLGGAAAGAYFGAGLGIVGGPLGAIAGTIPGALIGGIIGVLGMTEARHHLEKHDVPVPQGQQCQKKGAVAGLLAGAASGAVCGGGLGIAAGPLGAVAGTIPGAIVGGLIGMLSGAKLGRLG